MPIEKLRPSFSFTEDRLCDLQAIFPEIFSEGKINWSVMRQALGNLIDEDEKEVFELLWPGKREARKLANQPVKKSLVYEPGCGCSEENTHNIFIEGENLSVLKLLVKSYANRVKTIYIDPPYNTGNDQVYMDNFRITSEEYQATIGERDEKGNILTTNSKSNGR